MPDDSSRHKLRACRFCGGPLNASGEASETCDQCQTPEPHNAKEHSAAAATIASAGKTSSGEGEWITPSAKYAPGESSDLDLPARTKWRSPPMVIRFATADEPDRPAAPREKPPSRLLAAIKSKFELAAFAILTLGVLLFVRYGVPKSIRLPFKNPLVQQPVTTRQDAAQQQREAAFRQERDAKLRQQRAVAKPQRR